MTVQVDDRHEIIEEVGTTEAEAIEVGGIFHQVSQELRAAGYTAAEVEAGLGVLEGMTTGAGETLGGILAIYDDPHVIVEAAKAIPEAVENFDEIIEALPAAIEDQQQFNNPHDPGDQYYDDFRYGWYQGYFFWFVVEMAVPAGEAGKALKSTETVQSTVDRISTPQVQRAAQIAKQGGQTATAPVRYSRQQLSNGLAASIGITQDAGQQVLSRIQTTGGQYQAAKLLNRYDIDGNEIDSRSANERRQTGEFTSRHGEDGVRVAADGGEEFRDIVTTGRLGSATTDRLIRAYDRGSIDDADLQRISRGLNDDSIDQVAVETALTRINHLERDGHSIDRVRTADDVNTELRQERGPDYQAPYEQNTLTVEFTTATDDQFVRVHGSGNQVGEWMMRANDIDELSPSEIQRKYSLPDEPTHVSDVTVPSDTPIRTGSVEENFGGASGATQYQLAEHIPSDNFHNSRPLEDN
ncbi:hypothetical protein [Natronorubrum bangense]|uniref:von Willebrand factor A n=1 Tax=Natronorubrum bangense JCM 10635 TaxID=1227500 RepID=L9WNE6_9EURY|nr:hypothetical protein [Natronorubrum bangense]ELY50746.1 von Willebrand factor A [Natronorubrum bangense JCM 10635]